MHKRRKPMTPNENRRIMNTYRAMEDMNAMSERWFKGLVRGFQAFEGSFGDFGEVGL